MTLRDQIEARTNAANTSAVWKHSTEILLWNTYSSFAKLYKKNLNGVWQSSQIRNEIYLHAVVNKQKHFLVPAYFRQNKSSINIQKC